MPTDPTAAQLAVVDAVIARLVHEPGALMPILHAVQEALGYVPPATLPRIAEAVNLSRAEVHGVMTFYHDFRSEPPGKRIVELCRAEACQAMGSDALAAHLAAHHVPVGTTTPDLTVRAVYCLGNCALSPAVLVDGRLVGRVTPPRLDALIRGDE